MTHEVSQKLSLSLSVIIPVYNEEDHLRQCLDAIAAQHEAPDEVIVVDNNSSDNTVEIAKSYSFVKVLSEKKQGVFHARNTGFNRAASDIIGRIDADTRLDPDWTHQVKRIFLDDQVAAATGPVYWYDMPLKERNYFAEHAFKSLLYKYDKGYPFLFGSNMAIRRTEWWKVRGELCDNRAMHEDMDLAIHLYQNERPIVYDSYMRAGASTRRFDSGPEDFYRYSEMMKTSFAEHDMNPIGAKVAIAAYTLGYVTLYPLRRAYDDKQQRRSFRRLILGNKPRKNPMH